ncbi:Immunodominant surface protein gp36 [Ehrlichia minasensis]|nr:Immunodominant surface protein gp36 [Ehrlichia minasensis]
MLFILMGYCMLHLTTEITGIDFANDFHIHSGERFVVTSGDLQLEIGSHGSHGYHILFKNNGHVISDLHGVKAEDFSFDMKNRSLSASFIVDPMAPFHELDVNNHPNFSISMHAESVCNNCVHGNTPLTSLVNQAQVLLPSGVPAASGDAQVPAASGDAQVPAASGDAQVPAASGDAQVPAASGDAQVPAASGDAQVPAASGDAQTAATGLQTLSSRRPSGFEFLGAETLEALDL